MKRSHLAMRNLFIVFNVVLVIMFFASIPKWFMEGNPVSKYVISKRLEKRLNEKYDINIDAKCVEYFFETGGYTLYFLVPGNQDEMFTAYYDKEVILRGDTYGDEDE